MKRKTRYRLMTGILASSIFIISYEQKNSKEITDIDEKDNSFNTHNKEEKTSIIPNNQQSVEYLEETTDAESKKQSLEEFLNSIENKQTKGFYTRLYELYDYESFSKRSPIPQYFQTVYTEQFSVGSIRSAGCGISSLAMISSYLFEENITPDMMTIYDSGPSPASAFEKGIRRLKLNCTVHRGQAAINNLDTALEEGHPVIALVGRHSIFTEGGHFIVIAGKTPDGKYIVNDPNIENYYQKHLIDGYTNGFTKEQVTRGLNGIYIFDTKKDFIDRRDSTLSSSNKNEQPTEETNNIGYTKEETLLKATDSDSSSTIKNLEINTEITRIFKNQNGWDLVKVDNVIGYIKSNKVQYQTEPITLNHKYKKYSDLVITNEKTNLIKYPINYEDIITIDKNTRLETIAVIDNNWLLVKYNDQLGYIRLNKVSSCLNKAQELFPELSLTELKPNKVVYLSIDTDLRKGYNIEFKTITTLERYETVTVLGEYDEWYFVITNDNKLGFIPKKNTKDIKENYLVIDKSIQQISYLREGHQVYTTQYNNQNIINTLNTGIYPVLSKTNSLILLDPNSNWKNLYLLDNNIFNDVNNGDKVLIHR